MLPDFEAWAIFARVAEHGSFGGAARALGLSPATVSKAVARLEARLGERLVHRTSRRFALTEAGRAHAERAAALLAAGEAAEAAASTTGAVTGRVRLAAPMSFGLRHVAPALPEFLAAWPGVSIDLRLDDRQVDLVGEGIDVAVRIAELRDSSLVARRLCPVRLVAVAAPAYLDRAGRPLHPRDLAGHACLTYSNTGPLWRFARDGETAEVRVAGQFTANNADAFEGALLGGHGIALQPDFMLGEALAVGRLEAVLGDWRGPEIAAHLVMPPGGPRPPRVTALVEWLSARFSRRSWAA